MTQKFIGIVIHEDCCICEKKITHKISLPLKLKTQRDALLRMIKTRLQYRYAITCEKCHTKIPEMTDEQEKMLSKSDKRMLKRENKDNEILFPSMKIKEGG